MSDGEEHIIGIDVEGEGEELGIEGSSVCDPSTAEFDAMVGVLEDALFSAGFAESADDFRDAHAAVFSDSEENKLEYMPVFTQWQDLVEGFVETSLVEAGYSTAALMGHLGGMDEDELFGDVFELLLSAGDFELFKSDMLAHRAGMEGSAPQLELGISNLGPQLELGGQDLAPTYPPIGGGGGGAASALPSEEEQ